MGDKLGLALTFLATMAACNAAFLGVSVLVARALRLAVIRYVLGVGPAVFTTGTFTLRFIPVYSYFMPVHRNSMVAVPPELIAAIERDELRYYDDLPFPVSIGMGVCLAIAVSLGGAAMFLGGAAATHETIDAVRNYVIGALAPLSRAPELLEDALVTYRRSQGSTLVGHVLAVCAGIIFLWSPSNVMFLLGLSDKRMIWPRVRTIVWLITRLTEIAWCVGFIAYCTRR
jgi:hypothetical protein